MRKSKITESIFLLAVGLVIGLRLSSAQPILVNKSTFSDVNWESTIGVASGKITKDGRPLLWKNRGADLYVRAESEVLYVSGPIKYIGVCYLGSSKPFQGVNEKGFAILNSFVSGLPWGNSGPNNSELITRALSTCSTVSDFEHLLNLTNKTGRLTRGNFGAIDATGAAVMYEVSGSSYWKYDANDSTNADGFVVRTNFAFNGEGVPDGLDRYYRSQQLFEFMRNGDSLDFQHIVRYHARDYSTVENTVTVPYFQSMFYPQVPHWYIFTYNAICYAYTISSVVIHGVLPSEDPKLSTMWTMFGNPATTIAIPFWPVCKAPIEASDLFISLLSSATLDLRNDVFDTFLLQEYPGYDIEFINTFLLRDTSGTKGLWPFLFSAEDFIFKSTEDSMTVWRTQTVDSSTIFAAESYFASYALDKLVSARSITNIEKNPGYAIPSLYLLEQNYPNPFNPSTTIRYSLPYAAHVKIVLHDMLGRKITTLVDEGQSAGWKEMHWDAGSLSGGIYFYTLHAGQFRETKKMLLLK